MLPFRYFKTEAHSNLRNVQFFQYLYILCLSIINKCILLLSAS